MKDLLFPNEQSKKPGAHEATEKIGLAVKANKLSSASLSAIIDLMRFLSAALMNDSTMTADDVMLYHGHLRELTDILSVVSIAVGDYALSTNRVKCTRYPILSEESALLVEELSEIFAEFVAAHPDHKENKEILEMQPLHKQIAAFIRAYNAIWFDVMHADEMATA